MTSIFLTLILALSFAADNEIGANPFNGADKTWFQCTKDSDCTIMAGICEGPVAINKNHKADLTKFLGTAKTADCTHIVPARWPAGAQCTNQTCVFKTGKK